MPIRSCVEIAEPSREAHRIGTRDGRLQFRLRVDGKHVVVDRISRTVAAATVTQTTRFASVPDFERWCDADLLRFDYPLEFARLKSLGSQLLSRREHEADAC